MRQLVLTLNYDISHLSTEDLVQQPRIYIHKNSYKIPYILKGKRK